jgi:GNAT superfamily N-acetyltransferase
VRARRAIEADRERLLDVAAVAAEECEPGLPFERAAFDETFDTVLRGQLTCFVAEVRHEIVGFTLSRIDGFYFTSGISTSLDIIFVLPGWRGTRVPALLLRSFLEWSNVVGTRRKYLGINTGLYAERTARFFARAGARPLGMYMAV